MNAPLPESIRKALESMSLDDKPRSSLRRRHKHGRDSAAGPAAFGVAHARNGEV